MFLTYFFFGNEKINKFGHDMQQLFKIFGNAIPPNQRGVTDRL
jgi:hypothetical protein